MKGVIYAVGLVEAGVELVPFICINSNIPEKEFVVIAPKTRHHVYIILKTKHITIYVTLLNEKPQPEERMKTRLERKHVKMSRSSYQLKNSNLFIIYTRNAITLRLYMEKYNMISTIQNNDLRNTTSVYFLSKYLKY